MKKKLVQLFSVIDIGANETRLKICQNTHGEADILESLSYPLSLGRDTFNNGSISFEKADKLCEILNNFDKVSKEYGVKETRVFATSAFRESMNKGYILDQVRIKTGMHVEVIDNLEEKYYIYKHMLTLLPKDMKQSALMIHIGSGNMGVSVLEKEKIPFMQNIKVGSLRLSELFGDIQEYSREFALVVEEYLSTFTESLRDTLPFIPKHFIAAGPEISMICKLCEADFKNNFYYIHKNTFDKLYDDIKIKSVSAIMNDYGLPEDKAELILPVMSIFDNLLQFSETDIIVASVTQLMDAVVWEMLNPDEFSRLKKLFYKNTILSSKLLSHRFGILKKHHDRVEKFSVKIFDKLKKIHGLSGKERVLLQSAAILHDLGKIINMNIHYKHSYNIIKGLDIVGLNAHDLEIVACLSLYHSSTKPNEHDGIYYALGESDRVTVSKLSSILRIADSLDRSHQGKFDEIGVKLQDNILTISVETNKNIELEEWAFKSKSLFFEEVFGIKTLLKKKIPKQ